MNIIFPNNNEKEFLKLAEELKIKELHLIYNYKKNIKDYQNKVKEVQITTKIKLNLGILAKNNDIPKAKQVCNLVLAESSEKDQHVLEKYKPNLIFDLEKDERRDKTHYRLSGLNQVLCKLAKTNKTTIAFSFEKILNTKGKQRAILLGRIRQNLRFTKKYKNHVLLSSFAKHPYELRTEKDLKAFTSVLRKNL